MTFANSKPCKVEGIKFLCMSLYNFKFASSVWKEIQSTALVHHASDSRECSKITATCNCYDTMSAFVLQDIRSCSLFTVYRCGFCSSLQGKVFTSWPKITEQIRGGTVQPNSDATPLKHLSKTRKL